MGFNREALNKARTIEYRLVQKIYTRNNQYISHRDFPECQEIKYFSENGTEIIVCRSCGNTYDLGNYSVCPNCGNIN